MLRIDRRKLGVRIADVYFHAVGDPPISNVDVAFLQQSERPVGRSTRFGTLHIELERSLDELFGALSSTNRNSVRRAGDKDRVVTVVLDAPSAEDVRRFAEFYDEFARSRGLSPANRAKLEALRAAGGLALSHGGTEEDRELCQHAYIKDERRVRLLHSASRFREVGDSAGRSLIGRANRYLHWQGIVHWKASGAAIYDFGGLSLDPQNENLRNIDEFKLSFGGRQVIEYNCVLANGWVGRLALAAARRG